MKLSKYRIAAGHYAVGEFTIYGCYPRWQVRDLSDNIIEDFATLRESIQYALYQMVSPKNTWSLDRIMATITDN